MKNNELREKTVSELNDNLASLLREKFKIRLLKSTGEFTQTHKIKALRRDIARIETRLNAVLRNPNE